MLRIGNQKSKIWGKKFYIMEKSIRTQVKNTLYECYNIYLLTERTTHLCFNILYVLPVLQ